MRWSMWVIGVTLWLGSAGCTGGEGTQDDTASSESISAVSSEGLLLDGTVRVRR